MSYRILSNKAEIRQAHDLFLENIQEIMDERILTLIGFKGASFEAYHHYSNFHKFWCVVDYEPLEENRYWNAFGINKPKVGKASSIDVEINYPIEGIDLNIKGLFAKDDESKKIKLFHNGGIGGGRTGVGKTSFFQHNKLPITILSINGKEWDYVEVCELDGVNFAKQLKEFIKQVWNIKNVITMGGRKAP